jgi:hypothetical protein
VNRIELEHPSSSESNIAMRTPRICLALACLLVPARASTQSTVLLDSAGVRAWREDLAVLRSEMPARHANLFHTISRAQFDSALSSIEGRLPSLARHQVIVELQRLAASIGDGHTNVGPWRDSLIGFHTLPVRLYWFEEGLIVRAADSAHRDLIGARVVEIGSLSADSAVARVRPLISRDNEMGIRAFTPMFLGMPEVVHAAGIVPDPRRVRLVVEQERARRTVTLEPAGHFPMLTGEADRSWVTPAGWVDAREWAAPPLWLKDPLNRYWFEYLPGGRALFVQVNTIQHKPADSLRVFMARAIAAGDSAGAERLVLDLRLNGGGDGTLNRFILLPLIKSRYDVPGRLYVLTGRRTWSAAQMLVTELRKYTTAVFVGEPSASKGNHYGDSYRIVMPNSRVTVRVSTLWHQYLDTRDKRPLIAPAIPAPLTFAAYAAGRDPALEASIRVPLQPR